MSSPLIESEEEMRKGSITRKRKRIQPHGSQISLRAEAESEAGTEGKKAFKSDEREGKERGEKDRKGRKLQVTAEKCT